MFAGHSPLALLATAALLALAAVVLWRHVFSRDSRERRRRNRNYGRVVSRRHGHGSVNLSVKVPGEKRRDDK